MCLPQYIKVIVLVIWFTNQNYVVIRTFRRPISLSIPGSTTGPPAVLWVWPQVRIVIISQTWSWTHFTQGLLAHYSNLEKNICYSCLQNNYQTRLQFGTCHDSRSVVACAISLPELNIWNTIIATCICVVLSCKTMIRIWQKCMWHWAMVACVKLWRWFIIRNKITAIWTIRFQLLARKLW